MKQLTHISTIVVSILGVLVLAPLGFAFLVQSVRLDQMNQSVEAGKILLLTLASWGGVIALARVSFSNFISLLKKK